MSIASRALALRLLLSLAIGLAVPAVMFVAFDCAVQVPRASARWCLPSEGR